MPGPGDKRPQKFTDKTDYVRVDSGVYDTGKGNDVVRINQGAFVLLPDFNPVTFWADFLGNGDEDRINFLTERSRTISEIRDDYDIRQGYDVRMAYKGGHTYIGFYETESNTLLSGARIDNQEIAFEGLLKEESPAIEDRLVTSRMDKNIEKSGAPGWVTGQRQFKTVTETNDQSMVDAIDEGIKQGVIAQATEMKNNVIAQASQLKGQLVDAGRYLGLLKDEEGIAAPTASSETMGEVEKENKENNKFPKL